jgi:hypothetical protein
MIFAQIFALKARAIFENVGAFPLGTRAGQFDEDHR